MVSWLSEIENEYVFMGNNKVCDVLRMWSRNWEWVNKIVTLTKVRYIPGLKRNLISLCALNDASCVYTAEKGNMHVYKNGKLLMVEDKVFGLYLLHGACCNVVLRILLIHSNDIWD